MKNPILVLLSMLIFLASCINRGKHTTIVEKDNQHYMKIEYAGHLFINDSNTAISAITPHGYLNYVRDSQKLAISSDKFGHMTYRVNDGDKTTILDAQGKQVLAMAVKDVIRQAAFKNGRY